MAGTTGLEPAASAVTGQRSNQLNYVPTRQINEMRNRQCLCGFARFAYRAPVAPDCLKRRDFWLNRPQTATNLGFTLRSSDVQRSLRGPFQTIQVVTTLDPTTDEI
jgi:hypothetical protein